MFTSRPSQFIIPVATFWLRRKKQFPGPRAPRFTTAMTCDRRKSRTALFPLHSPAPPPSFSPARSPKGLQKILKFCKNCRHLPPLFPRKRGTCESETPTPMTPTPMPPTRSLASGWGRWAREMPRAAVGGVASVDGRQACFFGAGTERDASSWLASRSLQTCPRTHTHTTHTRTQHWGEVSPLACQEDAQPPPSTAPPREGAAG